MAELDLRALPASEALAFSRTLELAFGNVATDEDAQAIADGIFDPEWTIGVYDDAQLVATATAVNLELTLPAGPGQPFPVLAVPGVSGVGVLPTHRRRGLLTRMMAHQLCQFREREVPFAILTASESRIYGRYGYGLATSSQSISIASKRSDFVRSANIHTGKTNNDIDAPRAGRLRLVDAAEAATILPAVHQEARRLRPGEVSRPKEFWDELFRDPERHRHGGSARTYAVHEDPEGVVDGYVSYRYHFNWADGLPANKISVEDIYATSPTVEAALWRLVLDVDLVEEVTARRRPLDDPLRWLLAEPRRLRTTGINDFLWARMVDIPAALAARGYGAETELVLEVVGPWTERFTLATSPTGATCSRANGEKTDLVLGISQLGAIFLGGCPPSLLARAGLVDEVRPGALARADAAFASPLLPFCGTSF